MTLYQGLGKASEQHQVERVRGHVRQGRRTREGSLASQQHRRQLRVRQHSLQLAVEQHLECRDEIRTLTQPVFAPFTKHAQHVRPAEQRRHHQGGEPGGRQPVPVVQQLLQRACERWLLSHQRDGFHLLQHRREEPLGSQELAKRVVQELEGSGSVAFTMSP
jgi:hypothetical protein